MFLNTVLPFELEDFVVVGSPLFFAVLPNLDTSVILSIVLLSSVKSCKSSSDYFFASFLFDIAGSSRVDTVWSSFLRIVVLI